MIKPKLTPEEARKDHQQMLRFMALHALVGALIGAFAGFAIIWFDIGGIGSLIWKARNPVLAGLLIVAPFAFIFGGMATASAIITMPYDKKFRD
ncbi:hypothetical protein ACFPLB_09155 [Aquamicrobium segne]|uniref:Uncharacterized protein n=1 Tax=Aquamicrobium segne TaxID=469547 RepID=A0ABW0GXE8_9HYPH